MRRGEPEAADKKSNLPAERRKVDEAPTGVSEEPDAEKKEEDKESSSSSRSDSSSSDDDEPPSSNKHPRTECEEARQAKARRTDDPAKEKAEEHEERKPAKARRIGNVGVGGTGGEELEEARWDQEAPGGRWSDDF